MEARWYLRSLGKLSIQSDAIVYAGQDDDVEGDGEEDAYIV
jgi:hypothetical protein